MATFKEATQEKNRVAAVPVLRSEFERITVALSLIVDKYNIKVKEVRDLEERNDDLLKQIKLNEVELSTKSQESYEKIQTLKGEEQEIISRCNEKEAACKGIEQDTRDKVLKLKQLEVFLIETIADQNRLLDNNKDLISFQEQEIKTNGLTLGDIHVKILQSKEELRDLGLEKNKKLTNLDKQIKDKSTELETVSQLVQQERDKIAKPMELLTLEVIELKQIKQDLDIAQSQIAQRWQKVFPNSKYIYVNILRG